MNLYNETDQSRVIRKILLRSLAQVLQVRQNVLKARKFDRFDDNYIETLHETLNFFKN